MLNAENLHSLKDDTFTHSLSTFMIQFAPDPHRALQEMYRVTKAGGILELGIWSELCLDAVWQAACRTHDPDYIYPHTWTPDWGDEEKLRLYIHQAGFRDIQTKVVRPRLDFESPEAYCRFFFESQNPNIDRAWKPWDERGELGLVKPAFERLVREKFEGPNDINMKILLFVARK